MDKGQLSAALDNARQAPGRSSEEQIFIRLLKQVWEIDWTVAPYDVWCHMIEWDIPYFLRFMSMDEGDEAEEERLIRDWIGTRLGLRKQKNRPEWKGRVVSLVEEMNQLRASVRKAKGW